MPVHRLLEERDFVLRHGQRFLEYDPSVSVEPGATLTWMVWPLRRREAISALLLPS